MAKSLARYIPSDVIALYIPIAAGMETANWTTQYRTYVAVALAISTALYVWGAATWLARQKAAKDPNDPDHGKSGAYFAGENFKKGFWYILAGLIAAGAWATAVPDSWLLQDLPETSFWVSTAIVGVTSLALVILGFFFAPADENT